MKQITNSCNKANETKRRAVTMVTAYDYAMAKNVCEAGIEMIWWAIRWVMCAGL